MSATVSVTATADLERRLSVLEAQVGIAHRSAGNKNTSNTVTNAVAATNAAIVLYFIRLSIFIVFYGGRDFNIR